MNKLPGRRRSRIPLPPSIPSELDQDDLNQELERAAREVRSWPKKRQEMIVERDTAERSPKRPGRQVPKPRKRLRELLKGKCVVVGSLQQINVAQLEYREGGDTIWVHSPAGGTVLRIKTTGKIITSSCDTSPVAHFDIMVEGDIEVCLPVENTIDK